MSYIKYNPNPLGLSVGDCTVRAISLMIDKNWQDTYMLLSTQGLIMYDMPSANRVWGEFLKSIGFARFTIPDYCPDCYTVRDFCLDHPTGEYIVGTGEHVVAIINGDYYDSWDSGNEIPTFYFKRR